jgi:hypothetical protein
VPRRPSSGSSLSSAGHRSAARVAFQQMWAASNAGCYFLRIGTLGAFRNSEFGRARFAAGSSPLNSFSFVTRPSDRLDCQAEMDVADAHLAGTKMLTARMPLSGKAPCLVGLSSQFRCRSCYLCSGCGINQNEELAAVSGSTISATRSRAQRSTCGRA